jgi:hypothetical protein
MGVSEIKINIICSRKFNYTTTKQGWRFDMKNRIQKNIVVSSILVLLFITFNLQINIFDLKDTKGENEHINQISENLFGSLPSNASNTYLISNTTEATTPQVAVDRDMNVHIVWADQHDGDYDILYKKFNYTTQAWSTIQNLTDYEEIPVDQKDPSISVDEFNNIWVVWIDKNDNPESICGKYYNSSLSTWSVKRTIRSGQESNMIYNPVITNSTGGNFTIVYVRDNTDSKIWYQHYDRINNQWSNSYTVASSTGVDDTKPSVYYDAQNRGHLTFCRTQNLVSSIMYCNRTLDPQSGIYKFGIDATGQTTKILNVTQNLRYGTYTYLADSPDIISIPSKSQIYIAWQDRWNGTGQRQIRMVNLTLTTHIENSILNPSINNVTADSKQKYNPKLGLSFNSTNLALIWNDNYLNGRVVLKKTLSSPLIEFDHDSTNLVSSTVPSDLAFDKHNSLYVVYAAERSTFPPRQIWFRQYDVWNPQLVVNFPLNNTVTRGNVTLDVTTETDTRSVKYEYFIDTNGNGIDDDVGSWTLIREILSTTNQFDAEWNTTENGLEDHLNILIRVTAVDVNGLDDVIIKGHIIVDNHIPQIVRLTSIWDNSGHYSSSTAPGGPFYFCNITSFNYITSDNCSGVDFVRLYNGSTPIASNSTSGNNTAVILDTSNGLLDGTYTNLFVRAYDRTLNENSSVVITPTIIIDNKKPIGQFVDLVEGTEYSRNLGLNLTTIESDTDSVVYYYHGSSDAPGVYHLIGGATPPPGVWRRTWNTATVSDGQYTIRAIITDKTGWVNVTEMDISIDNTVPSPIILSPLEGQELGARILINVSCDLDTVQMIYYNASANPTQAGSYKIINSTTYYSQDEQHRYFSVYFNSLLLPTGQHYLKVMAIDNQNFKTNTTYLGVQITNKYPKVPQSVFGSSLFDSSSKTYNITLTWSTPASKVNITNYAIFRIKDDPLFFSPESIQSINQMSPIQKFSYLGNFEGDICFVKELEVPQVYDNTIKIHTWTDSELSASNYYYIIIAVNVYGNPSNCSSTITIHITAENPAKTVNLLEVEFLPYLAMIYAGVLAALTVISVKGAKGKQMHKETRVKLESMYEEKFSKEGEKTFEERMDEMEAVAETKVVEKASPIVKESMAEPVKKTKEDNFLDMKVTAEEVKTTEAEGPRRCPNCNWIISSKAFKCPRCGKAV